MATLGYVAPISQQSSEGFHALRRTVEGLVYYTKVNKDSTDSIDFDGGNPTDKNGNTQLPSKVDYTDELTKLQSDTQYFTGDNSTVAFTLSTPVLDGTRIAVYLNGVRQPIDEVWTFASSVITFRIAPFSGSQVAIGRIEKEYKNNTSDKYHQYVFEQGDATYYLDDDGYFVKRENKSRGTTALTTDDFDTFEATASVQSTSWQSAV
ncbi:hypothetical protein N8956_00285 [bacterium]|jgi:hypothetical protein|nr:hypothetical protein [bacterium]